MDDYNIKIGNTTFYASTKEDYDLLMTIVRKSAHDMANLIINSVFALRQKRG